MTAIQKAREALVAAREAMSDSEDFGVFIAVIAKIDAALAALDAETEVKCVTVRVEDTCDGLLINAEDMKRFNLRDDVQYPGEMVSDGRFRISLSARASTTPADVGELVERLRRLADYVDQMQAPLTIREEGDRVIYREAATALERVTRERDEAHELKAHARKCCDEAEAKLAEARKEADTLRARLETVEAETRERCAERAESFSLAEHIAFDMREGIFPEQSDRQTAIADAIRNLEPRHD